MTTYKKSIVATGALLLTLALAASFTRPSYADSASDRALAQWQAIYWYWALGDPDDAGVDFAASLASGVEMPANIDEPWCFDVDRLADRRVLLSASAG